MLRLTYSRYLWIDSTRALCEPAPDLIAVDTDGLLVDIETMDLDVKTSGKYATQDGDGSLSDRTYRGAHEGSWKSSGLQI